MTLSYWRSAITPGFFVVFPSQTVFIPSDWSVLKIQKHLAELREFLEPEDE